MRRLLMTLLHVKMDWLSLAKFDMDPSASNPPSVSHVANFAAVRLVPKTNKISKGELDSKEVPRSPVDSLSVLVILDWCSVSNLSRYNFTSFDVVLIILFFSYVLLNSYNSAR